MHSTSKLEMFNAKVNNKGPKWIVVKKINLYVRLERVLMKLS